MLATPAVTQTEYGGYMLGVRCINEFKMKVVIPHYHAAMREVELVVGRWYECRIPHIPQMVNVAIGLTGPHRVAHRTPIITAWEFRYSTYVPPPLPSQTSTQG